MAKDDLPPDLVQFITECLESVEQIHILQLLRDDRDKVWTAPELTKELRSSEASVIRRMEEFYKKGVLLPSDTGMEKSFRFSPANESMERLIERLIEAYEERPSRVVEFVYSQ